MTGSGMLNGKNTLSFERVSRFITTKMRFDLQSLFPIVRRKTLQLHPFFVDHYNLFLQTFDEHDYGTYENELTRGEKMQLFCNWFDAKLERFIRTMNEEQAMKYISLPEHEQYRLLTLWLEKEISDEYKSRTGNEPDKSRRDETLEIEEKISTNSQ